MFGLATAACGAVTQPTSNGIADDAASGDDDDMGGGTDGGVTEPQAPVVTLMPSTIADERGD